MSVDIYLDPQTNDIALNNGSMRLTSNIEESSRQQVLISLGTYKGEWVYNISAGIPYLENDNNTIKGLGVGNKSLLDSLIQADVLARENISKINSYSSELNSLTGLLTVTLEAVTLTGEVIVLDNITA